MKTSFFWGLLTLTLCFTGCSGVFIDKLHSNKDNPATYDNIISQEVVIGDELIYGDEYSFENVYKAILGEIDETTRSISYARSASSEAMSFELNELYKALITEYPLLKTKINNAFQSYYIQEGSKTGNLIDFQ